MNVLAVLEQRDGALRKVSHEVLAAARRLADRRAAACDALVLAAGDVAGLDQLGRFGADVVKVATHDAFALGSPDAATATGSAAGLRCRACSPPPRRAATSRPASPRASARRWRPTSPTSQSRAAR